MKYRIVSLVAVVLSLGLISGCSVMEPAKFDTNGPEPLPAEPTVPEPLPAEPTPTAPEPTPAPPESTVDPANFPAVYQDLRDRGLTANTDAEIDEIRPVVCDAMQNDKAKGNSLADMRRDFRLGLDIYGDAMTETEKDLMVDFFVELAKGTCPASVPLF